jgi:hypothetical protein
MPPAQQKEAPMQQSSVSAREPITLAPVNVALVEEAAKTLEQFSEKTMTTGGHSPSWSYPQAPDGLALCMGGWRLISASQLGWNLCLRPARR